MNRARACEILQISIEADSDEIRLRFRSLASRLHPDRFLTPGERAVATRKFQQLSEAFAFLRDSQFRDPVSPVRQARGGSHPRPASGVFGGPSHANISSWELLDPLKRRLPWLDFVLDILLFPAMLPLAVTLLPLMWLGSLLRRAPKLENLIHTLSLHFLPGVIAGLMGVALLHGKEWWAPVAGLWFILSGAASIVMELIAQAIGLWQLIHRPVTLMTVKDMDII